VHIEVLGKIVIAKGSLVNADGKRLWEELGMMV